MNQLLPLCKCGCGKEVSKIGCIWIRGHHVRSKEIREKISKSTLGKIVSDETKKKMSESFKGRIVSDETKKKLSESLKGHVPWNCGKNVSGMTGKTAWNRGISCSEETKEKMRLSHVGMTGLYHSDQTKNKISESLKGRKAWNSGKFWSEEIKEKISKSHIGLFGPWTGKKLSKEMIDKRNQTRKNNGWIPWNKGKKECYSKETLKKMRLSHYERLKKLFPDGVIVRPNIGSKELEFINLLKQHLVIDVKLQNPVSGYFLDCYIPCINLAIEFDEKNGHSSDLHLLWDKEREHNIIEEIGCRFYRIKEDDWDKDKNKVITDVRSFIEQKIKEI